jgi:hypothetical protein
MYVSRGPTATERLWIGQETSVGNDARFSVGINYWPRHTGLAMWRLFDAGEIREDFSRIAELGFDAVRFFVRWDDLQPDPATVDVSTLERIERVLALASDAGLRALPSICGATNGAAMMPAWARPHTNLYDGVLLDAQRAIANAIAARFRAHPAIVAWDIGHAFSSVRAARRGTVSTGEHGSAPVAEPEIAAWARALATILRGASLAATAGICDGDLIDDTGVRLGSLCAPFAFASMQGSNVDLHFARSRLDPEAIPFLATIAAAFSFKSVLITGVGNPTCPAGKFSPFERFALPGEPPHWSVSPDDEVFAPYPCLSETENAAYATAVLERLHADGRLGAYWWCWSDYQDDAVGQPHHRSYGILRTDGSLKPVATALSAFARRARTVVKPDDMPMISSTYYYRTLPVSARTLYDAFLSFVAERREALEPRAENA